MTERTVSHYRILERLGEGGMGVVYRAEDLKLRRLVALKFLAREIVSSDEARARFTHEAQAAAVLDHPNICAVHEIDQDDDDVFIAMAFLEGRTVEELIASTSVSPEMAVEIAVQIADGLAHAHERGVVHRDIKPANVMVQPGGEVKIMDFGLARSETLTRITRVGTAMGTVGYMSPEQACGDVVDRRTDIWSLGVILYEMLTGHLPFRGEHPLAVLRAILDDSPPDLDDPSASVPITLRPIITLMLAKSPADRYDDMVQVASDLRGVGTHPSTGTTTVVTRGPVPERRQRARWAFLGLGVATLAAALSLRFWLSPDVSPGVDVRLLVLPFENVGEIEDTYFAVGISDEIRGRLATVEAVRVVSRTSAMLSDRAGKTIEELGRDLSVDYVLDGTVRWDRGPSEIDRVRIVPQLIRVSDDTQLWSVALEADLEDVFALQAAIADSVLVGLAVSLPGDTDMSPDPGSTENVAAYDAYLRGRGYYLSDFDDERAVRVLERAIELDPEFAVAYALLSRVHSDAYWWGTDRTPERLQAAREAADRALALAPDSPTAHRAQGFFHYHGRRDYDRALAEFRTAVRLSSNDSESLAAIGLVLKRQGRWDEARSQMSAALEIDPHNPGLLADLGRLEFYLREFAEANRLFDLAIDIAPDVRRAYEYKIENYWAWKGSTADAAGVIGSIPGGHDGRTAYNWYRNDVYERGWQLALDRLARTSDDIASASKEQFPRSLLECRCWYELADDDEVDESCGEVVRALEQTLGAAPDDWRARISLGLAYARLGQKDAAVDHGRHAADLLPIGTDSSNGAWLLRHLAEIYACVDEPEASLDLIEQLLAIPSPLSIGMLRLDPAWDPLRTHPRFVRLLEAASSPPG